MKEYKLIFGRPVRFLGGTRARCSPNALYRSVWAMTLIGVLLIALAACGGDDSPASEGDLAGEPSTVQAEAQVTEAPKADDQSAGQPSTSQLAFEPCEPTLGENREVLAAFYHATGGPNWTDSENWLTDAPLSDWAGVGALSQSMEDRLVAECVTGLELGNNNLSGEIPAELVKLTDIVFLYLGGNQLSGKIPAELVKLTGLVDLNLSENQLSGEIPAELGSLSELASLDLSGNQLSGKIPAELGNLSELVVLRLSENRLSGEIPAELGNLTNLEWVFLTGNVLMGCVPQSLLDAPGDANRLDLPACN